jgi:hypothetical protein
MSFNKIVRYSILAGICFLVSSEASAKKAKTVDIKNNNDITMYAAVYSSPTVGALSKATDIVTIAPGEKGVIEVPKKKLGRTRYLLIASELDKLSNSIGKVELDVQFIGKQLKIDGLPRLKHAHITNIGALLRGEG